MNIEKLEEQKGGKERERRGFRMIEDGKDEGGCEGQPRYPFGEGKCANCNGPLSRYNPYFVCNVCKIKIPSDSLLRFLRSERRVDRRTRKGKTYVKVRAAKQPLFFGEGSYTAY